MKQRCSESRQIQENVSAGRRNVGSIIQVFSRPLMKVGRIIVPPVTYSTFKVKMTQIFSLGALREKLSHFDLKSRVKFLFRQ